MFANPNGFQHLSFSGPNNAGLSSAGKNVHRILNDLEVRSLERLLRVKSKVELRLPGRLLDKPPFFCFFEPGTLLMAVLRLTKGSICLFLRRLRLWVRASASQDCLRSPLFLQRTRLRVRARKSLDCLKLPLSLQRMRLRVTARESMDCLRYFTCPRLGVLSEVETGVNFRPAIGVRGQVAGSLPRRQPGTGTSQQRVGVVTPSLHPEVPDTRLASPGRGLGIRQSMGRTKVCETARSGTWVLKGDARALLLPANLDHLRVEWRKQGSYETAWVTPGHDCPCLYKYGHGAAVRPQTNNAIWGNWFVGQGRTPLVTLVCKLRCANGSEPEPVLRF